MVASLGGFHGFLETNQAPAMAYSIIQLASSYSFEATATALSQQGLDFSLVQHLCQLGAGAGYEVHYIMLEIDCTCSINDVLVMNITHRIFVAHFMRPLRRNH